MNTMELEVSRPLMLGAETAADLMTANPVSIREHATVREAITLLIDRRVSAAPVIDAAGRPVGVLSQTDILVHDRERVERVLPAPEFFHRADLTRPEGEALPRGFQVEKVDPTRVDELMTPIVFSVGPHAPAWTVIQEMLALRVHRMFVVADDGVLIGVISALDVLRHLRHLRPAGT
jgi:CBS domain-containing protein